MPVLEAGKEVAYTGAGGVRLVGQRWEPSGGGARAGTALLLHGGGQTRHSWQGSAARLARQNWLAITIDARGHGDSQWAQDGDYTLDAFAEDVFAIAETLDEAPVLIGASLGGITGLVAQADRPTLARALILVDIAPRIEPAGRERIQAFMTAAPDGYASLEGVADAVHAYNPYRPRPSNLEGLKKNLRKLADGRWHWHWDPRFLSLADEPARSVDEERLYDAARKITVPTLLVRGTRSDIVSPEAAAELLQLIPSATAVEVEAGHMVAGDDNDVFTARMLDFLANLSPQ
ncbi:MAG: alpha/beta hydrolase [Bradyrhizobium sp.]|nr:alpha/beta hydrolase [Bradyrhizobium sp.]